MLRRDFLQKQLEELSKALAKMIDSVLKLHMEGRIDDAFALAKENFKERSGMGLEEALTLSPADLKVRLTGAADTNPVQLNYLAELFYTMGELSLQKDKQEEAKELFGRSLMIYEHLNATERTYSAARQEKINNIKKVL